MRKKTWIIIFSSIAFLIVIVIAGNIILKSVVEKKLRVSLQQFQPFVQAGFSKAGINLFNASVQLDSLYVLFDPELKNQHTHSVHLQAVNINGINFFKLLMHKNFAASNISLNNADIKIDEYLLSHKFNLPDSFFKRLQFPFNEISFDNIQLKNAKISKQNTSALLPVCTGNISLSDVHIPKIDSAFTKDSLHFKNVNCDLVNINYAININYSVRIKSFHISSKDSVAEINELKLIPLLGKYEMGQKAGKQVDHITASVNDIKISGLNVMPLMQQKFTARQFTINNPVVYAFRDRRLPRKEEKQPTPLGYLKQIPYEMNVQDFELNNATVTSEEFPKDGNHTGYIKINNASISMKPFVNHATKIITSINSNVRASIMDAGNIHAAINLSLLNGSSHIQGAIDKLQLTAMNPSAEYLGRFHIESGVLDKLSFEFIATDEKATGQIIGVYHDLVIDRLKVEKDGSLKTQKVPSFLLHKIIIPKNKDASLDVKHRTGKIDYNRDPTRFVTFYYLKALLDGIRDSFALGFVLPK